MAEDNDQPIIIKRINKGGHSAHGGSWKVAFADFMTAMMAFFLVMWLVGQKPEVKEAVASYFKDPGKYMSQGGAGLLSGSKSAIKMKTGAQIIKRKSGDGEGSKKEQNQMALVAKKILEELSKQEQFNRLKKNIKIQMTSEGLRIILNESADAPAFFEPGSAKLLQKSAVILVTIAKELGTLSNRLVIEGHTDAGFARRKAYTNWELSADRANAARELIEVSGLWKNQIREVRGFADQFPMITDNPNDQRNRRITLVVLYQSREKVFDEIEVGTDLLAQMD